MGGRLAQFADKWKLITSDQWVLDAIQHHHIEFDILPFQVFVPREISFLPSEITIIDDEVTKLLDKDASFLVSL